MTDVEPSGVHTEHAAGAAAGAADEVDTRLQSLAPEYDEAKHGLYLARLEAAVQDPRNRNIALSGRYGTGKSSVLERFRKNHSDATLRISVPTLGSDSKELELTNRIQKEVLKQLIYSARAHTLRHSRFSRRRPLTWRRAFMESALFVTVIGALLALLGLLPSQAASGPNHSGAQRLVVWVLVAGLLVVIFAVLRMATYGRFALSDVSAAGATLKLSEPNHTYFDEHLDEIVTYFDMEQPDFVIFEDLDRFNDPYIFETLRELNTLLNNTPKRLGRAQKHGQPLRFIYAMRDSLFEKIAEDVVDEPDEDARAETVRTNRTKFFEVVIPIVPFITHRTARDLLYPMLVKAGITKVERPLVDLVGKYATDMRLLLNMRNEYLVFAERLLGAYRVAPGLNPTRLFALIAYKQFHQEDFEKISRQSSDLDTLYRSYRKLVTDSIAEREREKRALLDKTKRPPATASYAKRLGEQFVAVARLLRDQRPEWADWVLGFVVDSTMYDAQAVVTPTFWDACLASPEITIQGRQTSRHGWSRLGTVGQPHLEALFPDVLKGRWERSDAAAVEAELRRLDTEISELRGADWQRLSRADAYVVDDPEPAVDRGLAGTDNADPAPTEQKTRVTFGQLVDRTLKSDLAKDLVKGGHIDRNFTLYAAQFYGDFAGEDVARFIVQTVQSNSMDMNFEFTSVNAIANLLAEADAPFIRSISAYNVQVVDYLLANDPERVGDVVKHLATDFDENAAQFLAAFFTSGQEGGKLAALLSREPWRRVFAYLVSDEGVPADERSRLVSDALVAADVDGAYDLEPEVSEFIVAHYQEMPAFTELRTTPERVSVVAMLSRTRVQLPTLKGVDSELLGLVVEGSLYELTAGNLRAALGVRGEVSLDRARSKDAVYQYCLANLDRYLDAVDADDATAHSVLTASTLVDALQVADDETLGQLIATASPQSSLPHLSQVPESTWPGLAAAKLFRASLTNLELYRDEIGGIDASLGALLLSAGAIATDDADTAVPGTGEGRDAGEAPDRVTAAIAVLNAPAGIPAPEDRVQLVLSLDLDEPLSAAEIEPEDSNLFALLIKEGKVADDAATFAHLRRGGWPAVGPAIVASEDVVTFLTPALVDGMVVDVFENADTRSKIGVQLLKALAEFVPTDDARALTAAAKYAVQTATALPVDQIRRIAATSKQPDLAVRLLQVAAPAANDVVSVLNELGGKYSYLTTWEHDQFEIPDDEAHGAVFKTLKDANQCKTRKKKGQPLVVVSRP